MSDRASIALSIISGILLAVSFPQYNLYIFAWIALVPLLFAIDNKSLLKSFMYGWLAGFSMFVGQLLWLGVFHASLPILLSAYLALYFGAFCLLFKFIKGRISTSNIIVIPAIWTAIEFIRSIGIGGFPAGLLGYSQHHNLLLIQIADIVGIFGISFLLAYINASIYSLAKNRSTPRAISVASVLIITVAIVFTYGGIKMSKADNLIKNIKIAIIQPNIDYTNKQASSADRVLTILDKLTSQAEKGKPDLIIWPETVIKESVRLDPILSRRLKGIIVRNKNYLLFGNPDTKIDGEKVKYYNSAFLASPDGSIITQYNKIHPVPLWEIMPIRHYVPYMKNIEAKGICDRGDEYTVFNIPKGRFSALICFEGIFPDLTRRFVKNGAQLLINITNDSWSRSAAEHYQHASMNVFRAIENRVYYVRGGNSGVSEVIDPYGRVIKSLPIYQEGYLLATVGLHKESTIYDVTGDLIGYICVFMIFGWLGIAWIKKGIIINEA